jgi:WD40 repeat protein
MLLMPKPVILKLLLIVNLLGSSALAQSQRCAPPPIAVRSNDYNIFSSEQEMLLGELTHQNLSSEMRFVRDPQLLAYLNRVGERLIKYLPPTGLKFQFFIVDLPEANAFDVPGGYIFFSRKLIGFANNEDELSGVMAHELGHAVVRHGAIDFSKQLKRVLNVTQVGDRKDIAEKYNLLIERWRTKPSSRDSGESEQQLEADRIGLYAMIAAGYDPNAFAQFFGRLVETKGKTGSWFTDIFGKAKPEERRLGEMIKISEQLPALCRENREVVASQDFLKWQADVVSYHYASREELLPALLWKKELTPKLRSDVSHFAFSPDGRYFLAQDDSAITVIQREPIEVVFQIPAPEAHAASFTADGKFVVFGTENLRHEKWSIAEKKPVHIRELVVLRDCWEHGFSPDGNYLVCFDYSLNLNIHDTQTGKRIFEKKDFYRLTYFEIWGWLGAQKNDDDSTRTRFFNIEFSPDSRYLLIARSNKSRFRFMVDAMTADESDDTMLALDMNSLSKPLKTGGDLKKVTRRPFIFLDSNRILGTVSTKTEDSGIFSFPDGKRLARFNFGANEIKRTGNSNYVVVKPLTNARMGFFDLERGAIVFAADKLDADLWNDVLVYESASGKVLISKVSYDEQQKTLRPNPQPLNTIDIPVASIGEVRTAGLSDNLQWLAVSTKTRGAVWNLMSGERKLFLRGFKGTLVANNGGAIGDFPKLGPQSHSLALLNPFTNETQRFREIPESGARQYGGLLLVRQSLKAPKKSDDKKDDKKSVAQRETAEELTLEREVRFELKSIINDNVTWSREFPKEAPDFFLDTSSGRLILYWSLGSDAGKARLKEDPALVARAKELGNKDDDYLVEVVDGFAGKTVGMLLLETGKGSFDVTNGLSDGEWLVLHDSNNRVLVYSITAGDLRQRFFGTSAAINVRRHQILVENYPGDLTLYDLSTGDTLTRLSVGTGAAFLRFSFDGKKLFVLNAEQIAYAFDVDKLVTNRTQALN